MWTEASEEIVEIVIDLHFPDSGSVPVDSDNGPSTVVRRAVTKGM